MMVIAVLLVVGALAQTAAAPAEAERPLAPSLVWDALEKTYTAKPDESSVEIAFEAHNVGSTEILIDRVEPSCGCTVAELPANPWRLAAGERGMLRLKIDVIGKTGQVTKSVVVSGTAGEQILNVHLSLPGMSAADRERNQQATKASRQAVFQGDCARCHLAPTLAKEGEELFRAACGICHVSPHRASMVPDLRQLTVTRDAAYWHGIIAEGRSGTLMPAFAQMRGGPLSESQIVSLVDFLVKNLSDKKPTDAVP